MVSFKYIQRPYFKLFSHIFNVFKLHNINSRSTNRINWQNTSIERVEPQKKYFYAGFESLSKQNTLTINNPINYQ